MFALYLILSFYRALPGWLRSARGRTVGNGYLELAFLMLLLLHFAAGK